MPGYDTNFLSVRVPLPTFSAGLSREVLKRDQLRDRRFADYVNYTVVMHRSHRTPLFSALNFDQKLKKRTKSKGSWRTDKRIGAANQLNNDYYKNNPWDRGHLARRETAAWGSTQKIAQSADDATYRWSNASLQHENVNKDEWKDVEDWVLDLKLDKDDKISSFSGPVFGDFMRTIRPQGRDPAIVPAAFFKVVFFVNKQDDLEVRAFLVPQDQESIKDQKGRRTRNFQTYQVSVAEIERLTGLNFPDIIPERNPLFFNANRSARDTLNVTEFPERREVNNRGDIVRDNSTPRAITFADDDVDVFIAAAMVNPKGSEKAGEWVSIVNLSNNRERLNGWTLLDRNGKRKTLSGTLGPGEAVRVGPVHPLRFGNNNDGFIQLIDSRNRQIDRVRYTRKQARREGKPIIFAERGPV